MRRTAAVGVLLFIVAFAILLASGVTNSFGTGAQLRTNLGGSLPDGAAPNTFWDSPIVDLPGIAVTAVHCHGAVRYEFQAGATGPSHENACYAALDMYQGGSDAQWGVYVFLPGNRVVYRSSEGWGPWRYCVAELMTYSAPMQAPLQPKEPC